MKICGKNPNNMCYIFLLIPSLSSIMIDDYIAQTEPFLNILKVSDMLRLAKNV